MTAKRFAFGIGIGTKNQSGQWLEVFYPSPLWHPESAAISSLLTAMSLDEPATALSNTEAEALDVALRAAGATEQAALLSTLIQSTRPVVACAIAIDEAPRGVPDAYLRLHLISHRLTRPHGLNLNGLFGVLPNVAWTSEGAIDLGELAQRQLQSRLRGEILQVSCVDKFPKLSDYLVPTGVRIADTSRVRLGAYLGEGTTIMHEGFVNFNAGTEGPGMIEGRISAGVFVGKGSDLGGGCSTMGTLSGGGNMIISVGEECLIGANAGLGIPLGDRCTIESGLYVTSGSVVSVIDDTGKAVERIKARELAGHSDLLFRRNSTNGAIECLTNKTAIELNAALHAHN